jgi:hypothetical protein
MGWNELVILPQIDAIMRKHKVRYQFRWVSAPYPQVLLEYEGSIPLASAENIIALFPDQVYVQLIPGCKFPDSLKVPKPEFRK